LLFDLQAAINKAKTKKDGVPVRREKVEVERDGELKDVNLENAFQGHFRRRTSFLDHVRGCEPCG
jgi:hypothetical protein